MHQNIQQASERCYAYMVSVLHLWTQIKWWTRYIASSDIIDEAYKLNEKLSFQRWKITIINISIINFIIIIVTYIFIIIVIIILLLLSL